MNVIKLNSSHTDLIKPLFEIPKFMSVSTSDNYFVGSNVDFVDIYHRGFVSSYMSGLNNYHAFGVEENNKIVGIMAFYESTDDASWYWNSIRTMGNNKNAIRMLLDAVIEHNESRGRFKFYSMFPKKYASVYRRLAFSSRTAERYDYFDEFWVETKHQCRFTLPWQILYTRTLIPVDTVVRCTFLKQKYRSEYHAGRL